MEKIIAVNKIAITEKVFKEAAMPILRKKYNKLVLYVGGILIGLLLLISIVLGIANGPIVIIGEVVIIAAVLCYIRFCLPANERRRAYKLMSVGGTPSRETTFYSDHFNVSSGDKEDSFDYEDVLSTRETRNLLILTLKEGKEVVLDRGGFSEGGEADVMAIFLRR